MAGTVLSLCVVLLTIITGTCRKATRPGEELCRANGGICKNTYDGCPNKGKFEIGLCPGPSYWKCCVIPRSEIITPAPWRMCYDCKYSVIDGVGHGNTNCYDVRNDTLDSPLEQTNCTTNCTKEWLKLDEKNYQIVRRCANDCRPFKRFSDHTLHCCEGDLCNASWSSHMTCLPFLIRMVALLLWTILYAPV